MAILNASLLASASSAGERSNYLAISGPTPLRFEVPRPQYDPAKVLPPLKMADEPLTNALETVSTPVASGAADQAAASVSEPVTTPEVITIAPEPEPLPVAIAPEPVKAGKAEQSQVTPQMLLRYFKGDPNKEVLVPGPVEFTPPTPTPSGTRSSATYHSPPAK